jgi:hypothetical protein
MTIKALLRATSVAALLCVSGTAQADPYKFIFNGVISWAETPGISVGDMLTLTVFADNGGNSMINQVWDLSDLKGFTIKAGTYSASYSTVYEKPLTGNFVTDATGKLVSLEFQGTSETSSNTDNFGSWVGDSVLFDGMFEDTKFNINRVAGNQWGPASAWTVQSAAGVPEPAAWGMMIGGFGLAGMALRRRGKATVKFA